MLRALRAGMAQRTSRPRPPSSGRRSERDGKRPFDFAVVLRRIRRRLDEMGVPGAAMFELAAAGHRTLFEQLVACVLSIRTRDEVSLPTAMALFARAPTPAAIARLRLAELDAIVRASTFHTAKARTVRAIAERAVAEHGGDLPCDAEVLTSFRGVGPKCANLALGIACGESRIAVDIHVHRVTNRWGVVRTRTPEQSMRALEEILPRRYRVEINRLLVPFGKHVCTGRAPKCSTCPVLDRCRQVGVTAHR